MTDIDGSDGLSETEVILDTQSPDKKKPISQRIGWFFTFNNYEKDAIDGLDALFKEICFDWIFQEEVGESGTPHLQGLIRLKKAMRWTEFSPDKRIHWEPQKSLKAQDYCSKLKTKLQGGQCKYGGSYKPKNELKLITPDKDWQVELLEIFKNEPNDRTVYWYWSEAGNIGKSSFCKYLVAKHNCVFIDEGKKSDIMKTIMDANMDRENCVVVFDVPRDNINKVSYKSIESIKNGMIYSPKYESGYKLFNPPHIIVFCNYPPMEEKLSADRWVIKKIG